MKKLLVLWLCVSVIQSADQQQQMLIQVDVYASRDDFDAGNVSRTINVSIFDGMTCMQLNAYLVREIGNSGELGSYSFQLSPQATMRDIAYGYFMGNMKALKNKFYFIVMPWQAEPQTRGTSSM